MFNVENLQLRTYNPDSVEQRLFNYTSDLDSTSTITADGYFNESNLKGGDLITALGTGDPVLLKVTQITPEYRTIEMVEKEVEQVV